jgi:hypothetical protein
MAYREVTLIEITEVLRQRLAGARHRQIARRLGLDPKTVRRYVRAAARCELAGHGRDGAHREAARGDRDGTARATGTAVRGHASVTASAATSRHDHRVPPAKRVRARVFGRDS